MPSNFFPFTSVSVHPNYQAGHFVQWQIDPFFKKPGPYCFTLQASETETFSEVTWSKAVGDSFFAIDDSNLKQTLNQNWYYRILLVDGNKNQYLSNVVGLGQILGGTHKFRQGAEVMRIEQVTQRFTGQAGWLLKLRTFGAVDASATDPVSGAVVSDNRTSYGTHLVGGYYAPIAISWRDLTVQESRLLNGDGNGTDEDEVIEGRMIGYPKLTGKDIVVQTRTDKRFTVDKVESTYIPGIGFCVVQIFSGIAIPVTDTVYSIQVPK
jgi:hypothetical protein